MIRPGEVYEEGRLNKRMRGATGIAYTRVMLETRRATIDDAELITRHRKAMFADADSAPHTVLDAMGRNFEPWVRRMFIDDKYVGWVIMDGGRAVASAGFLLLDWAPHYLDPTGEQRGYVLNVFVEPEYRRRGLAQALMSECMDEARRRGIRVVALHASEMGQPVYEKLGFKTSNEMLFVDSKLGES